MPDPQATGALAGTAVGALGFLGGPATGLIGLGIGGGLGGAIGGLFGGRRRQVQAPDIGAELARIDAIITQAREQAKVAINRETAISRRALSSRLAARGVFESPVAGLSFEQLEGARLATLAQTDLGLLGFGAKLRAELLDKSLDRGQQAAGFNLDLEEKRRQLQAQNFASLSSSLVGLGTGLLNRQPPSGGERSPLFAPKRESFLFPGPERRFESA